ncbi:tat twin-arginine translocation pathway signal sequence domain protein [Asticcacaulis biprosthecium C19]|uniref:Dioxygenase n=1 Tax=Asticcacaulis biprosthecium C19 TaxID=715226 RepID=F4QPB4_9CAUL|nr:carotenoid oxygenase family protein [Asticcacaulis biprosthecium]EGF91172.1 tat twin-arginine translocation pathway signal sequence domain protein [Asticcacaulis biprosthecium C19]
MTNFDMSRRGLLGALTGAGAAAFAPKSWAAAAADWTIGVSNAPAEGYADSAMMRLHGRMPAGLSGQLYRNGPAWFRYGDDITGHWFDGDGMIQRYDLTGDGVRHSGKFVDTFKRRTEQAAGRIMMPGFGTKAAPDAPVSGPDDVNAANTSVMRVGDELWALWEGGSPYRVDPHSLATLGPKTFRDDLKGMAFLAHPKVEPSGRIWSAAFMGSRGWIWQLDARGGLERGEMIELPLPGYTHDWAVTERYLIFPMQPWVMEGMTVPISEHMSWKPEQGLQILVVDKNDFSKRRVYELPAAFYFHTGDAWEDSDGTLHFDVCLTATPEFGAKGGHDIVRGKFDSGTAGADLVLVSLYPDGRAVTRPTGVSAEFPQTDRRRQGLRRDRVVHVHGESKIHPGARALSLFDWKTGKRQVHDFGADAMVEEALFVPRPGGTEELDGWMVGTVLDLKAKATQLHVFDARHLDDGPVASWQGQHATPLGFHGTFVS